ncbi:MAG: HAD family hydrolase [Alphaproteobacteria bacterium]|nr:HAD family hydrolase [Alphaproteobacteria bacterium]
MKIKNIFWDVDDVLADLNHAYYRFLTEHPKWRDKFAMYRFQDLGEAFPVSEEYGGIALFQHPQLAEELNQDFAESDFYNDRPLFPDAKETVLKLHDMGIRQATLSATGVPTKKMALLKSLLGDLPIDIRIVPHDDRGDFKEENMLKYMAENDWNPSETVLIDDRPYNLRAAVRAGVRPVRFRGDFTTDTPADLKAPEFYSLSEFVKYIEEENK